MASRRPRSRGTPVAPDPEVITLALREWQRLHPASHLLVIIDPLEEIFVQTSDAGERQVFTRLLWRLARDPTLQVAFVAALRIDFIGRCGDLVVDEASGLRLVIYDPAHSVFVAQLGGPQLRAAIAMPARAVGVDLDPGLLERIVADVEGQPGALPIVQHALGLLWKRRTERRLTLAAYESIGGVGGALERHADGHVARLDPAQLRQAWRILVRLAGAANDLAPGARRRLVAVTGGAAVATSIGLLSLLIARIVA